MRGALSRHEPPVTATQVADPLGANQERLGRGLSDLWPRAVRRFGVGLLTPVLSAVRSAYAAGLSLLPTREDGSKAPALATWAEYKTQRPTIENMREWFTETTRAGFGM